MYLTFNQLQEMCNLSKQGIRYRRFSRSIRSSSALETFELILKAFEGRENFLFKVEEYKNGQGPKFRWVIELKGNLHQMWSDDKLQKYLQTYRIDYGE